MSTKTPEEIAAAEAEAKNKAEAEANAKAAAKAAETEAKRLAEELKTLIRVTKDGAELFVHRTCVKSHQDAGWKVAA